MGIYRKISFLSIKAEISTLDDFLALFMNRRSIFRQKMEKKFFRRKHLATLSQRSPVNTINWYFPVWILLSLPRPLHQLQLQHLQLVDHLNGLVTTIVMMTTTMNLAAGTEVIQNYKATHSLSTLLTIQFEITIHIFR